MQLCFMTAKLFNRLVYVFLFYSETSSHIIKQLQIINILYELH